MLANVKLFPCFKAMGFSGRGFCGTRQRDEAEGKGTGDW